ncbi:MAG: nicotinate (nicotinamide) nucleotide adenylyltransferase, partial [Phycisphaerae bacterium]
MSKTRILLFGGTFDPIHHGHLIACQSVGEEIGATRIILIPCAVSPFKTSAQRTPPEHRLQMCRLAAELDSRFEVSDVELTRGGTSYTIDTVNWFRTHVGADSELYWLIGADSLPQLPKWRESQALLRQCQVVVAARPPLPTIAWSDFTAAFGTEVTGRLRAHEFSTPLIDISATELRARAATGRSLQNRV